MKEIRLSQGKFAIVDDEDFNELDKVKWHAHKGRNTFYAARNVLLADGKRGIYLMHNTVLARKLGREITSTEMPDHENGNGLDNSRSNLRALTFGQNARNCGRHRDNKSSQYLGVTWCKRSNKWRAQICSNYYNKTLGDYSTEMEAAQAREIYIAAHPELRARCNFPKQERTP